MDYWPHHILIASEVDWRLVNRVNPGGVPVIGPAQPSSQMGAGLWTCRLSGIWVRKPEQLRTALALDTILDGGLTPIVVGSCETRLAPWSKPTEEVTHSDGATFSDTTYYAGASPVGEVAEAAPLRATSLKVELPEGVALLGGESFSIRHTTKGERRYRIGRVNGDTITFRPELREAVTAGVEMHFNKPGCVMRLANAEQFLSAIRLGRFADVDPYFVEAF